MNKQPPAPPKRSICVAKAKCLSELQRCFYSRQLKRHAEMSKVRGEVISGSANLVLLFASFHDEKRNIVDMCGSCTGKRYLRCRNVHNATSGAAPPRPLFFYEEKKYPRGAENCEQREFETKLRSRRWRQAHEAHKRHVSLDVNFG